MSGTTLPITKFDNTVLNEVLRQGGDHIRKIAIAVKNNSDCLFNNSTIHYETGGSDSTVPAEIQPKHVGLLGARKTGAVLAGTSGVMTYNIVDRNATLVFMWSVPMDFNIFCSWWNIKVFDGKREANSELFNELYKEYNPHKGDNQWYEGIAHPQWEYRGKMDDTNTPVLEIEISDRTKK